MAGLNQHTELCVDLKLLTGDFSFKDFCYEAADELCIAGGLIGNKEV